LRRRQGRPYVEPGRSLGPTSAASGDQANKTGESKDKIQRSKKRFEILGRRLLESIIGTSLDNGTQLDALMQLPEAIRDELSQRAAAGKTVFATEVLRENTPPQKEEQEDKSESLNGKRAFHEFFAWFETYGDLLETNGILEETLDFYRVLSKALCPDDKDDVSKQINERPMSKWFNLLKGRAGD